MTFVVPVRAFASFPPSEPPKAPAAFATTFPRPTAVPATFFYMPETESVIPPSFPGFLSPLFVTFYVWFATLEFVSDNVFDMDMSRPLLSEDVAYLVAQLIDLS